MIQQGPIKTIKPRGKKSPVSKGGRGNAAFKNPDIIEALKQAFAVGCTVEEACFNAGISRGTYYENSKQNPDITADIEGQKHRLAIRAKNRIANSLLTDTATARWYLERTEPEQYGPPKERKEPVKFEVHANFTTRPKDEEVEEDKNKAGPGSDVMKRIQETYQPLM